MKPRARKRELLLNNMKLQSPIIVPSFSSRAKPPLSLKYFLKNTLASIDGSILVSAYDVFHRRGLEDYDFNDEISKEAPFLVFLDSGGYELIWNKDAVDAGILPKENAPIWTPKEYQKVLESWPENVPLIATSFDNPLNSQPSIEKQIDAAKDLASLFPKISVNFLIKPPSDEAGKNTKTLELPDISPFVEHLKDFPLIGVTEQEIGVTMKDRLNFLIGLRDLLEDAGLDMPIHVFGGLDPQMTPLYFLAGADIFDGLSWLRYAFHDGKSLYDQGFISTEYPHDPIREARWGIRNKNILALIELEISMKKYLRDGDIQDAFGVHGTDIQSAWDRIWAEEY